MDDIEPSFNLRLIEAVKHSRCLYDSTDRMYRSAEYKMKVWNRLVQVLGFDGDAKTLYARWKQLRDKYGKEKKKMKYSGEHTTWQYYKHLSFLDPHMIDRHTHSPNQHKDMHHEMVVINDPNFPSNLIVEVQRHPCLYDVRDPKYRHSECRNQAWSIIIKAMGFPGDINGIYKQWKKLRDRYVREKRRLQSRVHGNGLNDPEQSSWDMYNNMQWMDPYLEDRASLTMKRKRDHDDMSDDGDGMFEDMRGDSALGYMVMDKGSAGGGGRGMDVRQGAGDVLLDGDSAFAASAVSDLRTLPEGARALARAQIENLLESGRMPIQQIVHFDVK